MKYFDNKSLTTKGPFSIAITTGGSDPKGVLITLFNTIDFTAFKNVSFTFLVGRDFLHKGKLPERYPDNVDFESYSLESIIHADVVIATFGVTTYELLYMGKPIISIGHAPSNARASRILEERTASIINMGLIDELDRGLLNDSIKKLIEDKPFKSLLAQQGPRIIDGKGVKRVSSILTQMVENER